MGRPRADDFGAGSRSGHFTTDSGANSIISQHSPTTDVSPPTYTERAQAASHDGHVFRQTSAVPSELENLRNNSEVASEEELENLRHVVDHIPIGVYVAAFISMAERFAFYGLTAPLQNYIQNSAHSKGDPGALGLGQSTATRVSYAFYSFTYILSLPWAVYTDTRAGRHKTLVASLSLYLLGAWILFGTSFNAGSHRTVAITGLAIGMALIGIGVGGVKSTISPFIVDQYPEAPPKVISLKNGKRVVADRSLTIQWFFNFMYLMVNIGALSAFATTFLEKKRGFWAAFLLPTCMLSLAMICLLVYEKQFIKVPPQGNIMTDLWRVYTCAFANNLNLDAARPEEQRRRGHIVSWDNTFIDELKRVNVAAKVILIFPLVYVLLNQESNNFVSQAGSMNSHGFPNDLFQVFNPLSCIVFAPIVQLGLYPLLSSLRIKFGPLARMSLGFLFITAGVGYAAAVQNKIYHAGPCYYFPRDCPESRNGSIPNDINIWLQIPAYVLLAIGEIFAVVSGSEYAYTKAPKSMKSTVQAISTLGASAGSAIGISISPFAKDPHMFIMYIVLAGIMLFSTIFFYYKFSKLDKIDEKLDRLELENNATSFDMKRYSTAPQIHFDLPLGDDTEFDIASILAESSRHAMGVGVFHGQQRDSRAIVPAEITIPEKAAI